MRNEKETMVRLEKFLNESPIPDTEIMYDGWVESTTRFTNNRIHQNVTEENSSLTVRTLEAGRIGTVQTNQLEQEKIKETIQTAVARMREQSVKCGAVIKTITVDSVDLNSHPLKVVAGKETVETKVVIIATGATAKRMGLHGEDRLWQK